MYYILRHGVNNDLFETEYHNYHKAAYTFSRLATRYQKALDSGQISNYTCLLLTKGVRPNEKTESSKH